MHGKNIFSSVRADAQSYQEVQRIVARVGELTGQVDNKATKDAWAMGIGLVLATVRGNGEATSVPARSV